MHQIGSSEQYIYNIHVPGRVFWTIYKQNTCPRQGLLNNIYTVKPLIKNTSKEFIKCRFLNLLIIECRKYLVFLLNIYMELFKAVPHSPRIFQGCFYIFTKKRNKKIIIWEQISLSTKKFWYFFSELHLSLCQASSSFLCKKCSRRHLINSFDVFFIKGL